MMLETGSENSGTASHVLKLGSHGGTVTALQAMLKRFDPTLIPGGKFGLRTERAVGLAQRRLDLFPPDGKAGPITLGRSPRPANHPLRPQTPRV